jgi:hypothetical protein
MENERDRQIFEMLLTERDKRLDERFRAQERALDKAETAMTRRLDSMNEIRDQLNQQSQTFLPRETFDGILQEWTAWRRVAENSMARVRGGLFVLGLGVPIATAVIVYLINKGAP